MKLLEYLKDIDESNCDAYIAHEKYERKFNMHQHEKGQLSFVEDGVAYLEINNQHFVVPAKHFFWIPARTPHQLKVSHSATQLHSLYFKETSHEFYHEFGIYPASNLMIELIKFTERWNNQFVNYDQPFTQCLTALLEIATLQKASVDIRLPIATTKKMEDITQYIYANFNKPLCLKEMTMTFNMSERSFCRLFKKELNTSFIQYLKTVRVINAIDLLVKTNMSIYEIANAVGYESLPAFSNIFLEYTHKRPLEIRNSLNR